MKKSLIILLIFFDTLGFSQTKKVLFIGNSYTAYNNLPQMVADLANSVGDNMTVSRSTVDGYSLYQHTTNSTTSNLIMQGGWDYVTLQEQSQNPSQPLSWVQSNVFPYAQLLNTRIKTYSPDAQTIFYMTWGRKNGDSERCPSLPEVCTYVGMDDLTRERYMTMAADNQAIVSPVGAVWRYIRENYPSIELYEPDGSHPSQEGSYAAACSFYTAIFRKDPTLLTYDYSLSSADAANIRTATKMIVYNNMLTWHIGEYDSDNQAPTAPTNLAASNITETGFSATWSASTDNIGVTGYNVYLNGVLYSAPTGTSANITGLSPSTFYTLTVRARDAAGNTSSSSSILNVTTIDTHAPSIPSGLVASNIRATSFTLTWSASSDNVGTTEYEVFRNGTLATTVSVTSAGITGLADTTTYQMTVRAKDAAGNTSGASNILNVTTINTIIVLSVSGLSANNKTYDGNTSATLNTGSATLVGVNPGDNVSLVTSGAIGTFTSKNVGTSRTISTSGFTLGGPDAGKYSLSQPVTSASITTAVLTVSGITANNKVYNGSTSATLNSGGAILHGVFGSDVVTLISSGAAGAFSNKNVGTGKTVTTSGFTLGGDDGVNYTLTQPVLTANITAASLTVTDVTASNRTYNGTISATLNTGSADLSGVRGGDNVSLVSSGVSGTFSSKNVGISKTVTISGFTITGSDAGNYTLLQPTTTANINGLSLTVGGVTANNKVYNGTTSTTLNTASAYLSGTIIDGDDVDLSSSVASGDFTNKNVGTGKRVNTSGFTLSGSDSENYILTQPVSSANITPATIIISGVIANTKIYNGTATATLNFGSATLTGLFSGDAVTINSGSAIAAFSDENAGNAKPVTISGITLSGADAANYTYTQPTSTGNITPLPLTITGVTGNNKLYDRTTAASINTGGATLTGILSGDIVTLVTSGASGSFANKNVGTVKTITTSGFTLAGTDQANYSVIQPATTANITPVHITISGIAANNKVYNGTTAATLQSAGATLNGVLSGDIVTLVTSGATGTFARKDVGTGIPVATSGYTTGGADGGNYIITQPVSSANITAATLSVSGIKANNKVYDGTNPATLNVTSAALVGIYGTDAVTLNSINGIGVFSNPTAGKNKPVSISGLSLNGAAASNYILTQPSTVADITAKPITITADNRSKSYKTELTFTGNEYSVNGLIPGDEVPTISLSSPGASESAIVGTYVILISGNAGINYTVTFVNGILTVNKAPVLIKADDKVKVYGEPNPPLTLTYSGFPDGEDQGNIDVLPVIETNSEISSDAGTYDIVVSGARDDNYTFTYFNGTLTITKTEQEIQFEKIPSGLRMTQEYELVATSSSGLPVTFELEDPDKGIVNGNILTILEDGNIKIIAKQDGNNNCQAAEDVIQSFEALPTFDNISSLFTPNSDGMNDYWYIPDYEQYGTIQVSVYNRFGQTVYKSESYKNDWDGTWNGKPLPSAAYYYLIKSSKKGFIKGVVNIVR